MPRRRCLKIDPVKLKNIASTHSSMRNIAAALGVSKGRLKYLLYTKYDLEEEEYTRKIRDAFYEGRTIYQKNRGAIKK